MSTFVGRAVKRALAGAVLTITLAGCDAAGLLDNVEITATGPKLLEEATEFAGAERINLGASSTSLTTALKTAQLDNSACRNLLGFLDLKDQALDEITGSGINFFCAVVDLADIDAVDLDGLSDVTNIAYTLSLAENSTVKVTYAESTDMNVVEGESLTLKGLGLHITSTEPSGFLGGVAGGNLPLNYVNHSGQVATYRLEASSQSSFLTVSYAYYKPNIVSALSSGFTGVQAGGSIAVVPGVLGSAVGDALADATSITFQLEAGAPEVTGKRAN